MGGAVALRLFVDIAGAEDRYGGWASKFMTEKREIIGHRGVFFDIRSTKAKQFKEAVCNKFYSAFHGIIKKTDPTEFRDFYCNKIYTEKHLSFKSGSAYWYNGTAVSGL